MNKNLCCMFLLVNASQYTTCENQADILSTITTQTKQIRKQQNIKTLVELTLSKENLKAIMQSTAQEIIKKSDQTTKETYKAEMEKAMNRFFNNYSEELSSPDTLQQLEVVYDAIYTEEEIEELVKFYESPVGKKTIQKLPELSRMITIITTEKLQKHLNKYIEDITKIQQIHSQNEHTKN